MDNMFAVVALLLAFSLNDAAATSARIIGGTTATSIEQFPWIVSFNTTTASNGFLNFCAGSLIHESWVLTAAHCTVGAANFYIRLGSLSRTTGGVLRDSKVAYAHPGFQGNPRTNDVALIKLSSPAPLSKSIAVIALIPRWRCCIYPQNLTAVGWGQITSTSAVLSPTLTYGKQTAYTTLSCQSTYTVAQLAPGTFCTVSVNPACQGDDGGPLVELTAQNEVQLVGVVASLPTNCAWGGIQPVRYMQPCAYADFFTNVTGIGF